MAPEDDPRHPFDWEGTPAVDPAEAPPQVVAPQVRRVGPRLLLGGLGAAVLVAVAVVVLSGGGGAGAKSPVVLAADVTAHEPGYKFNITVTAAAAGQNVSVNGSGAINTGPPLSGSMSATVDGVSVNELIVGSYAYVQSSTHGDTWGRFYLSGLDGIDNSSSSQFASTDPAAMLNYLRAAGTVADDGPQAVGGVATTHYHAVVDLTRYAAMLPAAQQAAAQRAVQSYQQATGAATIPIDVWIDHSNLVRQLDIDLSITTPTGVVSASLAMSFFDYGPQAAVSPPPADAVTDIPGAPQAPSTPAQSTPAPSPSSPGTGSTPSPD
ncbi:MAG TPA: hypothetical protein VN740_05465 [Solirubrobacteraceae bacterium]|nr:hypothetical protein [Solirubrobacteraceae bacterium]